MRNIFYMISAVSCAVLANLFYSYENYFGVIIAGLLCLFYLYKIIVIGRREKKAEICEIASESANTEQKREAIYRELLAAREKMTINRNKITGFMIIDIVVSVFVYSLNPSAAISLSLFLIPLGFLLYRNIKGIRSIKNGLGLKKYQ